jgi:hypothetical protein
MYTSGDIRLDIGLRTILNCDELKEDMITPDVIYKIFSYYFVYIPPITCSYITPSAFYQFMQTIRFFDNNNQDAQTRFYAFKLFLKHYPFTEQDWSYIKELQPTKELIDIINDHLYK